MTVHFWGERAEGIWTLEIVDSPSKLRNPEVLGKVRQQMYTLRHTFSRTTIEADVLIQSFIIIVTLHRQPKRMDTDPLWHISEPLPAPQCSALAFKDVGDPSPSGDP